MADRDVLFRIGLADHPDTAQRLQALADGVAAAQREISGSVEAIGQTAIETLERVEAAEARFATQQAQFAQQASRFTIPQPAAVGATAASDYQQQLVRIGGAAPVGGGLPPAPQNPFSGPQPPFQPPQAPVVTAPPASTVPTTIPQSPLVPAFAPEQSNAPTERGRDDAKRYETSFRDALGQMTGLSDDEMSILTGTEEQRWQALGRENGDTYRKGLRDSLGQSLGLSDEASSELFGAKTGKEGRQQQADYQADTQAMIDSIMQTSEAWNKLDQEGERVSKTMSDSFRGLARGAGEVGEGVGRLATGLAFLGAKNENIEKVVQSLLAIKGVSDVFMGVSKTVFAAVETVSLYGERQKAAARQAEINAEKSQLARQAAAQYVQVLERENITLEEATRGNREHADALRRVAEEAKRAADAERSMPSSTGSAAGAPGRAGGARGGRAGALLGLGGILGSEAIATFGGGGLASSLGGFGLDMLLGRLGGGAAGGAAAGAGSAAAGGAAAGAGGAAATGGGAAAAGMGGLAVTVGAAAAAIGGVTLAAVTLKESLEGMAKNGLAGGAKVGSLTDTIGLYEARIADYLLSLVGLGDVVIGGDKQAAKADKALKERQKQGALNDIQNETTDNILVAERDRRAKMSEREDRNRDLLSSVASQGGQDQLFSLGLKRENLQSELMKEQQFGSIFGSDQTSAGKQKSEDSRRREEKLRAEIDANEQLAAGASEAGGKTKEELLAEKRLSLADALKRTMEDVSKLESEGVKYGNEYTAALAEAGKLQDELAGVESEELDLIKQQKDARIQANQEAIEGANRRMDALQKERQAAEATLASGATAFARMSKADQARAIRAQEKVNMGGAESLTDKERGILSQIGTKDAVAGVQKADRAEAEKAGFFKTFGSTEQRTIDQATTMEKQLQVEVANKQQVNLKVETDYQRLAVETADRMRTIFDQGFATYTKELDKRLEEMRKEFTAQGRAAYEKRREANKNI